MHYHEAAAFVMPLGKHRDLTLDEIGATDPGLLYLDWLRGDRRSGAGVLANQIHPLDAALAAYLDDATIAAEVARLIRGR